MKSKLFYLPSVIIICLTLTSCSSSRITTASSLSPEPTYKSITIASSPDGADVYMDDKYIGVTPLQVEVPLKYQFCLGGFMTPEARLNMSAEKSSTKFRFVKRGYKTVEKDFKPTISYMTNYKNYNGQLWKLDYIFPEGVFAEMEPTQNMGNVDTTIPVGQSKVAVTRDAPGESALEKTIIRWYFDSEPRGARVFWRVVSSIPAEVKNTNESYLGTTPFEETRSFNILGLTYENSRDVQIEVKITKPGYIEQTKRFNVRQAIDQMEISSFYDLVSKD